MGAFACTRTESVFQGTRTNKLAGCGCARHSGTPSPVQQRRTGAVLPRRTEALRQRTRVQRVQPGRVLHPCPCPSCPCLCHTAGSQLPAGHGQLRQRVLLQHGQAQHHRQVGVCEQAVSCVRMGCAFPQSTRGLTSRAASPVTTPARTVPLHSCPKRHTAAPHLQAARPLPRRELRCVPWRRAGVSLRRGCHLRCGQRRRGCAPGW